MYFKIIIFCFLFLFMGETNIDYCPLENGRLMPDIRLCVRGGGEGARAKITGKKGSDVYTISDGIVKKIGEKTKGIYIVNKDLTYIYFCVDTNVKEGQYISAGSTIGQLNEDFLVLTVKKKGKILNARKFVNCLKE